MGKDWAFVAGDHIAEADLTSVKKLAGLNSKDPSQRRKIKLALGLTDSMIDSYEEKFGNQYELEEDEEVESDIEPNLDNEEMPLDLESMEEEDRIATAFSDVST